MEYALIFFLAGFAVFAVSTWIHPQEEGRRLVLFGLTGLISGLGIFLITGDAFVWRTGLPSA